MSDPTPTPTPAPAPAPTPSPTPSPAPTPTPSPTPTPAPTPAPSPSPTPTPTPTPGEPSWQSKFLSPELAADPTLARYTSLDDLAKGHKQTMEWARGRVAIPKADDVAGFAEFAEKVRPATVDGYTIPIPEGQADTSAADAFRGKAFEIGLHPVQAKALAEWDNQRMADAVSKLRQESQNTLTAYEVEIGTPAFHQRTVAIDNMLNSLGVDEFAQIQLVNALEQVGGGAGPALRVLAALAEKTGELAKVDGASVQMSMGTMTKESAQARLDEMSRNGDIEFQKRLADPNSAESRERKELLKVIAKNR